MPSSGRAALGPAIPAGLTTALNSALSLTQTGTNDGSIAWDFSVANSLTQYLADGETVTVVYTITVTDDSGTGTDTATQDVTVVITGTNLTVRQDETWRPIAVALEAAPPASRLVAVHPDPFNPRTTITFHLARQAEILANHYRYRALIPVPIGDDMSFIEDDEDAFDALIERTSDLSFDTTGDESGCRPPKKKSSSRIDNRPRRNWRPSWSF